MELMPRITRAQSMDVLSSMATISGYRAVEVDNVQALGTQLEPMLSHRSRVFGKYGDSLHVSLLETDAVAIFDIDRWDDLHCDEGATMNRSLGAMRSN